LCTRLRTASDEWPDLSRLNLQPTIGALHLWSQIVGKIRLMTVPWTNHSWHVPLYLSVYGLSTGLIVLGDRGFTIGFDLLADELTIRDTDGRHAELPLRGQSVADFYEATMVTVRSFGVDIRVDAMPCEIPSAVRFDADREVRPYDGHVARTYWRALLQVQRVFHLFRTRFVGKCSPIHLFWGSFDLALTRFSGRPAPRHPGGAPHMRDSVARDAYSQEVSSAGFWPGSGHIAAPCFYSYAYPTPDGFAAKEVRPGAAFFDARFGEFLLEYDAVRASPNPEKTLLSFLQSTYEAAATLALWNRELLESPSGAIGFPPEEKIGRTTTHS
jgi:hypothetical protein